MRLASISITPGRSSAGQERLFHLFVLEQPLIPHHSPLARNAAGW